MISLCVYTKCDICRPFALSPKCCHATNHNLSLCKFEFDLPQLLAANGASCQFILNHGRDNHHCMSLPFVEEGDTSENPTQTIHNIVMTTEEAVNEVLIRQRFIR